MKVFKDLKKEDAVAIQQAITSIESRFGKGSVMVGNNYVEVPKLCSTGSFELDLVLGNGIPRGRIIEIYGPEASGKTTLSLSIIAQVQKQGGVAAFVDAEHALDPIWAGNIGVDMDKVLLSQPSSGEEGLEIIESFARTNAVDVIVVDSVAALVPKSEIDGDYGDAQMGTHARLMSQAMRKLTGVIARSKCTVIFINQIRYKIGGYGNPETTTGGNALPFYASIRIEVRRQLGDSVKDEKGEIGMSVARIKAFTKKNKVFRPYKICLLDLYTGVDGEYGFSPYPEVLNLGVTYGIIEKTGISYSYNEERLGVGKAKAVEGLKNWPKEIFKEIQQKIEEKVKEKNSPVVGSLEDVKNSKDMVEKKEVETVLEKELQQAGTDAKPETEEVIEEKTEEVKKKGRPKKEN